MNCLPAADLIPK